MILLVWEFTVQPDCLPEFVEAYGPEGEWATLFRRHAGFLGTELLRDSADPRRHLTIDRWLSREHLLAMREAARTEYAALDSRCARLTESEREIGLFDLEGEG